jgi:CRISPR type IV-associated protein Csf3
VFQQNEKLRIRAYLQCGVVSNGWIPFDAILFFIKMRERYGSQDITIPGSKQHEKAGVELPFERREKLGEWYYACSFAQWPEQIADGCDHWNKKFDSKLMDYLEWRGKINIGSGKYRAYHMPIFYRHALWLNWYAVGDRNEIEHLLPFVTHIGKKYSQGWGRIVKWEIEKADFDWSEHDENGNVMRSLPSETGILYGIRPSYWLRENQVECILPKTKNQIQAIEMTI